ncbi:MAG TPA: septation protein SepH [Nocardioides sp.]|nr:septation protein SepH [Nocardioides sp.]
MAQLTFTGRSWDGKRLLMVDPSGQEHSLVIDARLRRALSGASESNGQLEIPMESTLRPRDIQARIRAGETPESVAHAASTSVEKIMPFAAPVMAERAHMVQRAQLASVRRRASESGARTLGDAVDAHLRSHNVDPSVVEWDAWRREDGRWTLTGLYDVAGRTGAATFSHDPRGNFVTVDDEDARWLIGDAAPASASAVEEPASDDLAAARRRRMATGAGPDEELALGEDAIEMVADEESATETTMEITATGPGEPDVASTQSVEADLDGDDASSDAAPAATEGRADTSSEPKARPAKKRGRASVPSWDEIMFGGGKND